MIESEHAKMTSVNMQFGPAWIKMQDVEFGDSETLAEKTGQISARVAEILREMTPREAVPVVIEPLPVRVPVPTFWQRLWAVLNTDVRVLVAQLKGYYGARRKG